MFGLLLVISISRITPSDGIGCGICKTIVSAVEAAISVNTSVDEIMSLLDIICDMSPEPVKDTCEKLVSTSIPIVITLIDQGIEAAEICTILKYCTGSSEKLGYHRPMLVGRRTAARPLLRRTRLMPRDFCSTCTEIVHLIEKAIDSGASIETIEEMLDSFCESLPGFQSLCESLVNQYTPLILEFIDQGIEALEICQKIGVCSSRQQVQRTHTFGRYLQSTMRKSSFRHLLAESETRSSLRQSRVIPRDSCSVCKGIVKVIEQAIDSGASIDTIEELLDSFCETLPAFQSLCEQIVNKFVPTILELIDQGIGALEICKTIGLCSSDHQAKRYLQSSTRAQRRPSFVGRKSSFWSRY